MAGKSLIEALDRRRSRGPDPSHRRLPDHLALRRLRRLRGHAPRVRRTAAGQDARAAARRTASPPQGFVVGTDPVAAVRDAFAQLVAAAGRDRRLDPPRGALGLDAPRRRRARPQSAARRDPRRARRRRPGPRGRPRQRARDRERDRRRRAAPGQDPRAGEAVAGELPDPLAAERPERLSPSRRRAPPAPGGRHPPQRGHRRRTPRSRIRIPTRPPMHAVRDERVDEIIVSTFPGEKQSSWLRGNLVERLRKDTKLPVEHVEVERPRPKGSRSKWKRTPPSTITTGRRRRTSARASTRACSGCCSSSARRSCSSGRSSRPTSSSGSSTTIRGRTRATTCPSSWPGSTRRSWSPPASPCTGR